MSEDRFDLTGRVAVITGATKGMGACIAERFTRSGDKVALMSRNLIAVQAKSAELNARHGGGGVIAVAHAGSLHEKADLQGLVDKAVSNFGRITTLVCSPSIDPWIGRTIDMPDQALDEQVLFIFKSRFWLSCMVISHMIEAGGGQLIYIGSGSPFEATAERSVNACMRAAEVQMMKNFAAEYGPDNVRANIIAPGSVHSHGARPLYSTAAGQARADSLPLRRWGRPEEIAAAAAFLASDASAFTTGAVLPVDGGRMLHASYDLLAEADRLKKIAATASRS